MMLSMDINVNQLEMSQKLQREMERKYKVKDTHLWVSFIAKDFIEKINKD